MAIIPEYPTPEEEAMQKAEEEAAKTATPPDWRTNDAVFEAMCDDMYKTPVRDRTMETIEGED